MIKLHPNTAQLKLFAQGNCNASAALMISAHVDMCPACSNQVNQLQNELCKQSFQEPSNDVDMSSMIADITQLPAAERPVKAVESKSLVLDGRSFTLPRALQRYADKTGSWSHLVGKLWQAPVDLGDIGKAHFIYMGQGGKVPEHTHRGNELTLVIDGEFSDGLAHYDTGDFIEMDGSRTHTPHSDADEGCLVFSIVDAPLHFTSGLARLLNPFSHLFFK